MSVLNGMDATQVKLTEGKWRRGLIEHGFTMLYTLLDEGVPTELRIRAATLLVEGAEALKSCLSYNTKHYDKKHSSTDKGSPGVN